MVETLGEQFARAVAAKNHDRIRELLHPKLDGRIGWLRIMCSGMRAAG